MTVRYRTNWMGPINMDWIRKNGAGWSAGRIDCRGLGLDPMYGDEIGLSPMKTEDWNRFGDWLDSFTSGTMLSLDELVNEYEKTNPKIVWFNYDGEN